ncbi:hypothetical protein QVD17_24009 [Tagetes erecta]|uniref:Uncharacterized protein n=1 Tax=Tagetes erecta TaxID=13708 RepID=A0AAD8KF63_TARER|nr:hypothetical protein QVD17_24009 [Tagetes erecta]
MSLVTVILLKYVVQLKEIPNGAIGNQGQNFRPKAMSIPSFRSCNDLQDIYVVTGEENVTHEEEMTTDARGGGDEQRRLGCVYVGVRLRTCVCVVLTCELGLRLGLGFESIRLWIEDHVNSSLEDPFTTSLPDPVYD